MSDFRGHFILSLHVFTEKQYFSLSLQIGSYQRMYVLKGSLHIRQNQSDFLIEFWREAAIDIITEHRIALRLIYMSDFRGHFTLSLRVLQRSIIFSLSLQIVHIKECSFLRAVYISDKSVGFLGNFKFEFWREAAMDIITGHHMA
jgi:hypothetical protein